MLEKNNCLTFLFISEQEVTSSISPLAIRASLLGEYCIPSLLRLLADFRLQHTKTMTVTRAVTTTEETTATIVTTGVGPSCGGVVSLGTKREITKPLKENSFMVLEYSLNCEHVKIRTFHQDIMLKLDLFIRH